MRARIGDHIVVRQHSADPPERRGEVVEVREGRRADEATLYIVRWPDGHESACFADSDVVVERTRGFDDQLQTVD
jgi:hypothetical protein